MARGVVLFHTIHDLFRLEAELNRRGIATKAIPTPRELSSDCGSALAFDPAHLDAVRDAVTALKLETEGIAQVGH
ncbi:MAG TPA: DUF3343 domain-containing protein [Planctomycetota bacterium]|nr:DUF3343 domain-containing protein [Planctomycetota bacterium]HRR80003.1 DUF3343 domain-containing protein [Planctomycetota bacterium]HRT96155.1 DUF3343 domain-containing protein [Planctomycetota bacterium]